MTNKDAYYYGTSVSAGPLAPGDDTSISVLPPKVDLSIYQGDDFWLDLTVKNPDGTDADLTDAHPAAQVRTSPEIDPPITAFDIVIEGNILHLHLSGAASAVLPASTVWDCQISTPYVTTLCAGVIDVTSEVTRGPDSVLPPDPEEPEEPPEGGV